MISEIQQAECPTSVISRNPQMNSLVSEVISMQRIKEASGAVPFGMDTTKWPTKWFDAVRIAEIEDYRFQEARDKVRESIR